MKNAPPGSRRTDFGDLAERRRNGALKRVSVIRGKNDPAADMGEWIIDEMDS